MLIATRDTLYTLNGGETAPQPVLDGGVQAIAEGRSTGLAALQDGEVAVLSKNGTRTLATGIEDPVECLLILEEEPLRFLVGVEAPHVYAVTDRGAERLDAFDALECRDDWYTPWGGPAAVRSMASTRDGWVYADIHVGSIMRSPDRGRTWEPVTPDLHEDVHQVATSPVKADRVYANTAQAVYLSNDRGRSWQHRSDGFPYFYGRAIAVHPEEPECLLASVSTGPHGDAQGQLYRTDNAVATGRTSPTGSPRSRRAISTPSTSASRRTARRGRSWTTLFTGAGTAAKPGRPRGKHPRTSA
jgi:hypothetical protein